MADKKVADTATLTQKQRAFIDEYLSCGNQTEAARRAGYKQPHVQGAQNLGKLRPYIESRLKVLERPRIADMIEINEFWSKVIRGEEKDEEAAYNPSTGKVEKVEVKPALRDRLKAAELRAKVQGAFVENVNHTGDVNITVTVDDEE